MSKYSSEVKAFISEHAKGKTTSELANLVNSKFDLDFNYQKMRAYKKNHGFRSGIDSKFKAGNMSGRPIKKGERISVKTEFKTGEKPHNWVPIGSERINKYGYHEIKIQDGKLQKNWKAKHVILWEEAYGPIPDKHVLIFGDKDKNNIKLDNIILITRKQLLIMNKNNLIKEDGDLTKAGVVIASIHNKINEINKIGSR